MGKMMDEYRASLKSMDTEEHIDLAFYRPIGYMWACLARALGVTPNAITIASIFLGIGAGVAFYYDNYLINLVGVLLLVWANSFDSADGQLARMTKQYSRLGRILDGLSGDFWFLAIYIAICLREVGTSHFFESYHWCIWVMGALAGLCHSKQATVADYYRQFHLYFLKGAEGSELDSSDLLRVRLARMPWKGHFWERLTLWFYTKYTMQQEALSPRMQALRKEIRRRWPDGNIPTDFRQAFRKQSLPLMKWTNFLTFNWRTIALFLSIFIMMPWVYFAIELTVFNVVMVLLIRRHEHMCQQFTKQLQDGQY